MLTYIQKLVYSYILKMKLIAVDNKSYVVDASTFNYGRLCTEVCNKLLDKDNIHRNFYKFTSSVTVKNIYKVNFSSKKKLTSLVKYKHSGYPGSLRIRTISEYIERNMLERFVINSIRKMLPKTCTFKNRLISRITFVNT